MGAGAIWSLLRWLAARCQSGSPIAETTGVAPAASGWQRVADRDALVTLDLSAESIGYRISSPVDPAAAQLLDLYLPLCVGPQAATLALGHVGQSLDGYVAAESGESRFVTGTADVEHTHRLRALFDAVIVGRETVANDDPELTTRLVAGDNPVRVVIDPARRLRDTHRVFRDGKARTLWVCASTHADRPAPADVEVVGVECLDDGLCPRAIRSTLGRLGLKRLFVEGGGVTVSRFLAAGVLARAHVTVAPVFFGSGRRGVAIAPARSLDDAWRPRCRRFLLGEDVLYDCEIEPHAPLRADHP